MSARLPGDIDAVGIGILEADADVFAQVGKTARLIAGFFSGSHKNVSCFSVMKWKQEHCFFFRRPCGYLQSTV